MGTKRIWGENKTYYSSGSKQKSLILTIPATLRRARKISKGDRFRVITREESDEIILEPIKGDRNDNK